MAYLCKTTLIHILQRFLTKKLYINAGAVLLLFVLPAIQLHAAETPLRRLSDQQVKTAFLYNLMKYITWTDSAMTGNDIKVGILGRSIPGNVWGTLNGKTVHSKKIRILTTTDSDDLNGCHVIFILSGERKQISRVMAMIGNDAVLTVSEVDGFITQSDGMVEISLQDGRIAFSINLKRVRAVGLDTSSQLLKLASKVY